MTVINTNVSALRAQNSSRVANNMQATAMERLSSGKRINSAKDDAAGLAIDTRAVPLSAVDEHWADADSQVRPVFTMRGGGAW